MKTWLRNLCEYLFWVLVSIYPAWQGYKDYLDLKTKDVTYVINDILPIPGELVMFLWFALAVVIAYFSLSGLFKTIGRRFRGDKNYYMNGK